MMKKSVFLILILLAIYSAGAGDKYFTKTGHISFISHTPIIDIDADNGQVASVIDIRTGEMVFAVIMKAFKFKLALAEEHFNENYVDSERYPKSNFKGKITNIEKINLEKNGKYDVIVEGDLTIKGATNKVKTKGTMQVNNGIITAKSSITIALKDYKIEVPAVVRDKVAENIIIDIEMTYKPYTK